MMGSVSDGGTRPRLTPTAQAAARRASHRGGTRRAELCATGGRC